MRDSAPTLGIACLVLAVILILMYLIARPASSQEVMPCGPTGPFEESMRRQYGEVPVGAGITMQGLPLLILANPETGSFTVTMRKPGRITCIINAGKGWTAIEPPTKGTDL